MEKRLINSNNTSKQELIKVSKFPEEFKSNIIQMENKLID